MTNFCERQQQSWVMCRGLSIECCSPEKARISRTAMAPCLQHTRVEEPQAVETAVVQNLKWKSVFTQAGESSSLGAETSSFDVIYSGGVLNAATFILKEILNLPPKKVLASDSQGRQYV
nr:guanine nucleotide-binding protein G(I)/G(S)/G(O) subunit gamma-7 isoform X1 [Pelodiscus sinensis]|eukprot:XP_025041385.1 guanine nucleotide-binding protein G(I)/G(S)/G(O) subunit gamma-7 isoform X1 [Pelodiscus sinensis]